jgi:chromosome segregation ATPase
MPVPLAVPLISGAISFVSGLFGSSAAKRAEQKAAAEKAAAQRSLNALINDRQDIINPFEDVKDLSSMLNNPMANLSVATQAAEMQVEEADISLANTLDTVRATGASAGGATALAQAALQSKKGVSASIEAQEAQNEKLRAQGEQQLQQQKMSEAQGKQFVFGAQENRDTAQMDRLSAQISGAGQRESQASSDRTGAITGMVGSLASIGGSYMSSFGGASGGTSPSNAFQSANPRNRASGSGATATGVANVLPMGGPAGQFDVFG